MALGSTGQPFITKAVVPGKIWPDCYRAMDETIGENHLISGLKTRPYSIKNFVDT
jgi:hypothetical protein